MTVTTEEAVSNRDSLAIMSSADAASAMLQLNNYEEPDVVLEAIDKFLDAVATNSSANKLGPQKGAMALGSLWGNAVLMAYDWKWIKVIRGDWNALGLVDAERKYLALPHQMFVELLSSDRDPSVARPSARFNAIGAKELPPAEPRSYTIVTG